MSVLRLTAVVLILALGASPVSAFHFYLHTGERRCFTESAPPNTKVLAEYTVSTGRGTMPVELSVLAVDSNRALFHQQNLEHGKFAFIVPHASNHEDPHIHHAEAHRHHVDHNAQHHYAHYDTHHSTYDDIVKPHILPPPPDHHHDTHQQQYHQQHHDPVRHESVHQESVNHPPFDHHQQAHEEAKHHEPPPNIHHRRRLLSVPDHDLHHDEHHDEQHHDEHHDDHHDDHHDEHHDEHHGEHHDEHHNNDEHHEEHHDEHHDGQHHEEHGESVKEHQGETGEEQDDPEELDMEHYDGIDDEDLDKDASRNEEERTKEEGNPEEGEDAEKEEHAFAERKFEICFVNTHHEGEAIRRRIKLVVHKGEAAHDYARLAKKEHMSQLEVALRRISDELNSLMTELDRARVMEDAVLQRNEGTSKRVTFLSLMSVATMVVVGGCQAMYTKQFFKRKKIL